MKQVFLTCSLTLFIGLMTKLNAQCDLGFGGLNITRAADPQTTTTATGTVTRFTVDVEFNLKYNENAKVVYLHMFLQNEFTNFFNCDDPSSNVAPTSVQLGTAKDEPGKSLLDLAIDNSAPRGATGTAVPVSLLQTYGPDNSVELTSAANSPDITVTKAYSGADQTDHFVVKNMYVYINNYNPSSELVTQASVWANDGTNNIPQCTLCPQPVYLNDPVVSGESSCSQYYFKLDSRNPAVKAVTYKVYIDNNENGAVDATELPIKTGTATFVETFESGTLNYTNNSGQVKQLLVSVEGDALASPILTALNRNLEDACAILPVNFKSFTAARNKQRKEQVQLKWETEKEQNNRGFYVQRNTGGEWQNVSFVNAKSENGNSNIVLTYEYTDVNTVKGMTQYRLLQVDLDSKSSYSEVKAVAGTEQAASVVVYPNPAVNGKVNILFSSQNSVKEVIVSDLTGRLVKHYPQITSNNLTIEGLTSGFYTIKITDRSTSVSSVEKVVVK